MNILHSFNKIKSSEFHSKPLEILIADIDGKIDASMGKSPLYHKDSKGRMISPYSYSTYHKYNIILRITEHLGSEFSQIRDYIEQEISDMFDDFKTLLDIKDFQTNLVNEFTKRNLIKLFRTKDVPQLKKQSSINTSDVTEEKKKTDFAGPLKEEFDKQKVTPTKDWETAKEFAEGFIKICNESNKDLTIHKVPEIPPMLKEKNWRLCGQCLSSNCQLLQYLAKKNKTQPKFIGNCTGKSITLGEVANTLKLIEKKLSYTKNKKKSEKKKQANGNAAEIEPIANNYSADPYQFLDSNQDLLTGNISRQSRETTVGFNAYSVRISQLPDITEKILPVWEEMKDSKKHKCIICGKERLHLERYSDHMVFKHQISLIIIIDQNIIDNIFTFSDMFIKEIFGVIHSLIKNGMGWGLFFIILLHCTDAKAALTDTNGALSLKQQNGLGNPTFPETSLTLGAGERTAIYGATTVFTKTKTYIMNLGAVEEKLIETINKSHDAVSTQNKICKNKPTSCPIARHIKNIHENSIKKSSQILANLGLACKTRSANNKHGGSKHLAIPGPIIFSTVMGTSSSPTSAATAHAITINIAHKLTGTKAPQRNSDIKNGTTSKASPWTTPDKTNRHSDQALENFSADIKSIVSQNKTGLSNSDTKDMITLAKNTATVVTTLIPTN